MGKSLSNLVVAFVVLFIVALLSSNARSSPANTSEPAKTTRDPKSKFSVGQTVYVSLELDRFAGLGKRLKPDDPSKQIPASRLTGGGFLYTSPACAPVNIAERRTKVVTVRDEFFTFIITGDWDLIVHSERAVCEDFASRDFFDPNKRRYIRFKPECNAELGMCYISGV